MSALTVEAAAGANGEFSARAAFRIRRQMNDCMAEIASLQTMERRLRARFPALIDSVDDGNGMNARGPAPAAVE